MLILVNCLFYMTKYDIVLTKITIFRRKVIMCDKIYPNQFNQSDYLVQRDKCFIIMPFDEKYNILYNTIKENLKTIGINCCRNDNYYDPKPFINKIMEEILRSQYIIAVLTNYRPNVFYELGFAHSKKDIQNVILIKENESDNIHLKASDISHLSYIGYNMTDLKSLASQITQYIQDKRLQSDFNDILYAKKISENTTSDFTLSIQSQLGKQTKNVLHILLNEKVNEKTYQNAMSKLKTIYKTTVSDLGTSITKQKMIDVEKQRERVNSIIKLYCELLISSSTLSNAENDCRDFLSQYFNDVKGISEDAVTEWHINFCLHLTNQEKFLSITLPWIIEYFKRSKSTSLDLNRPKLEKFLFDSNNLEVNTAISEALSNPDCHIREHMADIIGEKKLYDAKSYLTKQLLKEENYYTASSIITAIGKINYKDGKQSIMDWLNKHYVAIKETKQEYVLKHVEIALNQLGSNNIDFLKQNLNEKYSNI